MTAIKVTKHEINLKLKKKKNSSKITQTLIKSISFTYYCNNFGHNSVEKSQTKN